MTRSHAIGGFIGLELPAARSPAAFERPRPLLFHTARAALAHLLAAKAVKRVWVPAYVCAEVAETAALEGRSVHFYGVGGDLTPRTEVLESDLRAGDAVVGVDYFGAVSEQLPGLRSRFPDVLWIQDRAQGLWPAPEAWGDHILYSPRKVVGAPDGGALVSLAEDIAEPSWAAPSPSAHLLPALARFEDPAALQAADWFPLYREVEAALDARPAPMSRLGAALLGTIDAQAAAARRRENAALLCGALADHALLPASRLLDGSPLGVPVLVEDAREASVRLAAQRIYCARHWAVLPSPAADFPEEHALSRRMLTLPCDQRYGAEDMRTVAAAVRGLS